MDKIKAIEPPDKQKDMPGFQVGDTVKVYLKIIEEGVQRIQAFEGMVIGKKGAGRGESFTVRRISYGEGVERTFPLYAPTIERVEIIRRGKIKRAKLYYLRKKIGKRTAIEEKIEPASQAEESERNEDFTGRGGS